MELTNQRAPEILETREGSLTLVCTNEKETKDRDDLKKRNSMMVSLLRYFTLKTGKIQPFK